MPLYFGYHIAYKQICHNDPPARDAMTLQIFTAVRHLLLLLLNDIENFAAPI